MRRRKWKASSLLLLPMTNDEEVHVLYSLIAFSGVLFSVVRPALLSRERKDLNEKLKVARRNENTYAVFPFREFVLVPLHHGHETRART